MPDRIRPEGWKATYLIGRTDQLSNQVIIERGNEYYQQLLASRRNADLKIERGPNRGSLAWLIPVYKSSEYWTNLKPATQQSYKPQLEIIRSWSEASGHPHISSFETRHIAKFLEQWRETPRTRKYYKVLLSILFNIALAEGLVDRNIVKELRLPKTKGNKKQLYIWEQSHVDAFVTQADAMGYWNAGTAVMLAFETGQRQTDIFNFQVPRDYHNGRFAFQTSKTSARIYIGATQPLQLRLAQRPNTQLMLTLNDKSGLKWNKNSFRHVFREITSECGLDNHIFKQIRNSAAIRAERADLTDAEFEAIFGWPKENVRQMMKDFYGDRDQEVADRGIAKMEIYRQKNAVVGK